MMLRCVSWQRRLLAAFDADPRPRSNVDVIWTEKPVCSQTRTFHDSMLIDIAPVKTDGRPVYQRESE